MGSIMDLLIKRVHADAVMPTFAHDTDAGLDLCTPVAVMLKAGERAMLPTGLAMGIPVGYVGLIWDKSGLSNKNGLKSLGGVIDAGYRGEVVVGLLNTSGTDHTFAAGEKIAQILIQKVEHPTIIEVDDLDETARGSGAFGSTGK